MQFHFKLFGLFCGLVSVFFANLLIGATAIDLSTIVAALFAFDADIYDHYIVVYQRLPRALIAVYMGSMMAVGGHVMQTLTRNPLASPASLGINAGATLSVIICAFLFQLDQQALGIAALIGAALGFLSCLFIARATGGDQHPSGLSFILSGTLTSMLFIGIAHTLLLSDPVKREDYLDWVMGNINHVYIERLDSVWWVGLGAGIILLILARPLTLLALGREKAASAGVPIHIVTWTALTAVMVGAGSAVAICGPIGFVGLVVPHMIRPFFGIHLWAALPASAMAGGSVILIADIISRTVFTPYILHTGIMMDLVGGLCFAIIVRKYYLKQGRQQLS